MDYILLWCLLVSFVSTVITIPPWIKRAKLLGLVGKDMNKFDKREIAELGGLTVLMGFIFGTLTLIAIETFYYKSVSGSLQIMAVLSSILIIAIIGIMDDVLGWKIGLKQWQKPLLTLFAALPIVVINAGDSTVYLPLIGRLNIGLIYPLVFIPIGVVVASNGFNMIAGYNGLESSLGIIILATLGFFSWKFGMVWVAILAFCMTAALIAFLIFNKYPSKLFPGDTLTYSVGALIAAVAIMANLEKAALILFVPYFVEGVIKAKNKFKTECFSIPQQDGSLEAPNKVGSSTHLVIKLLKKIKKKVYENDVVITFVLIELILVLIAYVTLK